MIGQRQSFDQSPIAAGSANQSAAADDMEVDSEPCSEEDDLELELARDREVSMPIQVYSLFAVWKSIIDGFITGCRWEKVSRTKQAGEMLGGV